MHLEKLKINDHLQIANILTVFQIATKQIARYENSITKKISNAFKKAFKIVEKIK